MHTRKYESDDDVSQRPHLNTRRHLNETTKREADEKKEADKNKEAKGNKKAWRVQRGFAWPPRISMQGIILYPTINSSQGNPYKEKIPQNICIMRIFPTRKKPSLPRNKCQLYATIKTSKPSQTKVCIIYPNSGTLESWKFFNLTIGGYWASTTPVLSTRSFLFLFHRFYLEHVRTVWLTDEFWRHQYTKAILQVLECLGNINNSLKWNMTYI